MFLFISDPSLKAGHEERKKEGEGGKIIQSFTNAEHVGFFLQKRSAWCLAVVANFGYLHWFGVMVPPSTCTAQYFLCIYLNVSCIFLEVQEASSNITILSTWNEKKKKQPKTLNPSHPWEVTPFHYQSRAFVCWLQLHLILAQEEKLTATCPTEQSLQLVIL